MVPGQLNDVWLLGALAAAANHPAQLVRNLVVSETDVGFLQSGVITFQFYKDGDWVPVSIDSRVPYGDPETVAFNSPVYGRCRDPNEVWVPLMEKALAKLHSNYVRGVVARGCGLWRSCAAAVHACVVGGGVAVAAALAMKCHNTRTSRHTLIHVAASTRSLASCRRCSTAGACARRWPTSPAACRRASSPRTLASRSSSRVAGCGTSSRSTSPNPTSWRAASTSPTAAPRPTPRRGCW